MLFLTEIAERKNNKLLYQITIERNKNLSRKSLIVANGNQYFLALDKVEENFNSQFLLEPIGENISSAMAP